MSAKRVTTASAEQVWAVLAKGWFYGLWVVGSSRIRAVDEGWPAVGKRFHHSVGMWPFLNDDYTEVITCDPTRYLKVSARIWPLAKATVELAMRELPDGGCEIQMLEYATSAPLRWIPVRAQDIGLRPRNVESLRRLALLAEGGAR
jgi:hypothetical protein